MSEFPHYNTDAICPKCLCADVAVHYRARPELDDPAWRAGWGDKDFLLRVCQRCYYQWAEQTAEEVHEGKTCVNCFAWYRGFCRWNATTAFPTTPDHYCAVWRKVQE